MGHGNMAVTTSVFPVNRGIERMADKKGVDFKMAPNHGKIEWSKREKGNPHRTCV